MLLVQPKKRIAVRYGRNAEGELVRAFLLVSEIEGKLFFKILKVEKVNATDTEFASSSVQTLPAPSCKFFSCATRYTLHALLSPFLPLLFYMSQPTRAPAEGYRD